MPTTLAFFPLPEDLDDDLFGVPVLCWSDDPTPPSPELLTVPPDAEP